MLRTPNAQSQEDQVTLVCVLVGKRANPFSVEISENAKVEDLIQAIIHAQRNQLRSMDTNQINLARAKKDGDTRWVTEDEFPNILSAAEYPKLRAQAKLCYSQLSRTDIGATDEVAVAQGRGHVHVLVSIHVNEPVRHRPTRFEFSNRLAEIRAGNNPKVVLRFMQLDSEKMKEVATAFEDRNTDVEELDLRNNEIGDDCIASLTQILGTTNVQQLLLGNNRITDAGASELADALKNNSTIQVLDLHRNRIGDNGASGIAVAIKNNLQMLDMGTCEIKGAGACALAKALESNTTLTKLNLMGNCIEARGAKEFKNMFENGNTTLTLVLSKHHLGRWRRWQMRKHNVMFEYC